MIKKIFISLIFLTVISLCAKAQMKFETETYSQALKKAKNENKKVFIDCYTSWCGPCKYLAANIFTDSIVGEYMNKEFVNFKTDMEKGEGVELKKKYRVEAFPTLLILNSDGTEINRLVGAPQTPSSFITSIKKASNLNTSIEALKTSYEKDINQADLYLRAIGARGIKEEKALVMKEIFVRRLPEQRYAKASFAIYNNLIKFITEDIAIMILADRENAIKYVGSDIFDAFVSSKTSESILSLYMGDVAKGVRIEDCKAFEAFADKYPEISNVLIYQYFAATYKQACAKEIDKFLETSLPFFARANQADRKLIQKFTYRLSFTAGKKDLVIDFYENCKAYITDEKSMKDMQDTIDKLKDPNATK